MGARSEETSAVHRSGEPVATKLHRIAEKARKEPSFKFTSLYHLLNEELLRGCFKRLRKDAAAGIDKMTKDIYAENLDANFSELIERLKRMVYIPQPVRRKYIPKPGSTKQRPLGIPCFEDKLVQAGLVQVMESVYEQDFVDDSYGFRPSRSCHDALKALSETVENRPINHIVEADIKGFFDNVSQEWLMKFLEHRIGDKRIQRMVKRFLKAGVVEDGSATVIDMSPAYIAAVLTNLPGAAIVFDHFHLIKLFNDKLSKLRRELQRQAESTGKKVLKGTRWLLLKNPEHFSPEHNEKQRLEEALRLNSSLATAYYLKEDLRQLWQQTGKPAARAFLDDWIARARAFKCCHVAQVCADSRLSSRGNPCLFRFPDFHRSSGRYQQQDQDIAKTGIRFSRYGFLQTENLCPS